MDWTVTSTSLRVVGWLPPELVVPHPDTVALLPSYSLLVSPGRQAGLTEVLMLTGEERVRMEKSLSRVLLLYWGWSVILERLFLVKELSSILCSPTRTARLLGVLPAVQWAAVRTCWGEMRVPPHQGWLQQ